MWHQRLQELEHHAPQCHAEWSLGAIRDPQPRGLMASHGYLRFRPIPLAQRTRKCDGRDRLQSTEVQLSSEGRFEMARSSRSGRGLLLVLLSRLEVLLSPGGMLPPPPQSGEEKVPEGVVSFSESPRVRRSTPLTFPKCDVESH